MEHKAGNLLPLYTSTMKAGRGSISSGFSTRMLERDPSKTCLIARLRLHQASRVRLLRPYPDRQAHAAHAMEEECADIIRADTIGAAVYWSGVWVNPYVVIATTPGTDCDVASPMESGPEFATNATYGYFDNKRVILFFSLLPYSALQSL